MTGFRVDVPFRAGQDASAVLCAIGDVDKIKGQPVACLAENINTGVGMATIYAAFRESNPIRLFLNVLLAGQARAGVIGVNVMLEGASGFTPIKGFGEDTTIAPVEKQHQAR
jgi:hypothetical protein